MPKPPKNHPLTETELDEMETELSENKINKNIDLSALTRNARYSLQDRQRKLPLVNGDPALIEKQVIQYLQAVEKSGNMPTIQSMSRSIGHSRQSVYYFLDTHPNTEIAEFLEMARDAISEVVDLAAMTGKINPVYAIFTQKSLFGRIDRAELYLNTPAAPNPLGEPASPAELQAIKEKYLTD